MHGSRAAVLGEGELGEDGKNARHRSQLSIVLLFICRYEVNILLCFYSFLHIELVSHS
jgi:hypothetical protein